MNVALRNIITGVRPEIPNSVRNNLLAYYSGKKLNGWNNATDKKWFDSSGNGRHADLFNVAFTGNSNLDQYGFNVDGVDDYATIADSGATRLTTGGTLFAWMKPRGAGGGNSGRIFDKSTNIGGTNGYRFIVLTGGKFLFNANDSTNTISVGSAFTLNNYTFVAATFNSAGRILYANAIDVTDTGGATTTLPPDVTGNVTIGGYSVNTSYAFNGQLDRLGICNRPLTQAEIYYIYQNTRRYYGV